MENRPPAGIGWRSRSSSGYLSWMIVVSSRPVLSASGLDDFDSLRELLLDGPEGRVLHAERLEQAPLQEPLSGPLCGPRREPRGLPPLRARPGMVRTAAPSYHNPLFLCHRN